MRRSCQSFRELRLVATGRDVNNQDLAPQRTLRISFVIARHGGEESIGNEKPARTVLGTDGTPFATTETRAEETSAALRMQIASFSRGKLGPALLKPPPARDESSNYRKMQIVRTEPPSSKPVITSGSGSFLGIAYGNRCGVIASLTSITLFLPLGYDLLERSWRDEIVFRLDRLTGPLFGDG